MYIQGCKLAVATSQMQLKYSPGDLILEGYMPRVNVCPDGHALAINYA